MDFLVLPDHPVADDLVTSTPELATASTLRHPSGRPWLLGWWPPGTLHLAHGRDRRLAVLGHTRVAPHIMETALHRATDPAALDGLARTLVGCHHLLATIEGTVRAQGTVATARQLFTAPYAGITIAASAPDVLAAVTGAARDDRVLAARLLAPTTPWPLSHRCLWHDVRQVRPGHWLRLRSDGSSRSVPWWTPPEPDQSLARAADEVGSALHEAVAARAEAVGRLSADLSGGLDSTCLTWVAAHQGVPLHTVHAEPADSANPDSRWAARTTDLLGATARHTTLPARRDSAWFSAAPGPLGEPDGGEGPLNWRWGGAHLHEVTAAATSAGATLHLMGLGGDELFGMVPTALWSLVRRHPFAAPRPVRRYQLLNRWRGRELLRELADRTPCSRAVAGLAERLTQPAPHMWQVRLGWVPEARMPEWSTPEAVAAVRDLLREEAATPLTPLAPDRYRHQVVEFLTLDGTTIRQTARAMRGHGVTWEAPFLDDRVVEAALRLRLTDRLVPGRFKPLLVEAVRGVAPDAVLSRTDKGEFSAELYEGVARDREGFQSLGEDLRLAASGLVDAERFTGALLTPPEDSLRMAQIETTVGVEAWLRSAHTTPRLPGPSPSASLADIPVSRKESP